MFGPIRGPWGKDESTGWWGDDPPYHHPVFVLTNHARRSIPMSGGATSHFVVPILLGGGERLFASLGGPIGYRCVELVSSPSVVHLRLSRTTPRESGS